MFMTVTCFDSPKKLLSEQIALLTSDKKRVKMSKRELIVEYWEMITYR